MGSVVILCFRPKEGHIGAERGLQPPDLAFNPEMLAHILNVDVRS